MLLGLQTASVRAFPVCKLHVEKYVQGLYVACFSGLRRLYDGVYLSGHIRRVYQLEDCEHARVAVVRAGRDVQGMQ